MVKRGRKGQGIIWTAGIGLVLFLLVLSYIRTDDTGKSPGEKEEDTIVLRLWYPWANEESGLQNPFLEAVEELNRENSHIQIEAEGIEGELYRTKLPTAVATNDTPDIYFCYADAYLRNIAGAGKILKLNGYLEDGVEDKIKPGALEGMKYEEGIYGLGFRESYGVFLVNREMFRKYGFEIPGSWEELIQICRGFLDKGVTPLACSADEGWGYFSYLQAICLGMAGKETCQRIISGNGESETDDFMAGLDCFRQLKEMGAFGDGIQKRSAQEVENEFYLSRIPMYYAPNEFLSNVILENCPLHHKIEAVLFPVSDVSKTVLGGITESFVVNSAVKYPQEAVHVLNRLVMIFAGKLYETGAGLPVWYTEGAAPPADEVWQKANDIYLSAEEKMVSWDIYLDAKQSEIMKEEFRDFIEGKISSEELMNNFTR